MDLLREEIIQLRGNCANIQFQVITFGSSMTVEQKLKRLDVLNDHTPQPTWVYEIYKPQRSLDQDSTIADVMQNKTREVYKIEQDPGECQYMLQSQVFQRHQRDDWTFCGSIVNKCRDRTLARTALIRDELLRNSQARSKQLHRSENCDPDEFLWEAQSRV